MMPDIVIEALIFAAIMLITGAVTSIRNTQREFIRKNFEYDERLVTTKSKNKNFGLFQWILFKTRQAGYSFSDYEIGLFIAGIFIGTFIISYALFGNIYVALATAPFGMFIVYNFLVGRIQKRADMLAHEMEDWLVVLASHLRSGLSLSQSIIISLGRMEGILKPEVEQIVKAIEMGNPVYDALELIRDRIPAVEFKMVLVATRVNIQLGGNLAKAYEKIAFTIGERRKIKSDFKSLSAQGRIASSAIGLVVIGLIIIIRLISPNYLNSFFESTLGVLLFCGGIGWAVFGWWLVRRITMPRLF